MLIMNLPTAEATVQSGRELGMQIAKATSLVVVGLSGDLGAGKTSFVSGVLAAFGVEQGVRSPTYTLIEPYDRGERCIYHLDLYRLRTEEELEDLGVRELLVQPNVLLIEWIDRSSELVRTQDLHVSLDYPAAGIAGRVLRVEAMSAVGKALNLVSLSVLSRE